MCDNTVIDLNVNLIIKKILLWPFLFRESINTTFAKKSILCFGNPIPCPSVMYNKECIGYFEFSKGFYCNMDWDAWLRLAKREGSFIYVKERLVIHRIHNKAETSIRIKSGDRKREDERIFKRLWPKIIAVILARAYYAGANFDKMRYK